MRIFSQQRNRRKDIRLFFLDRCRFLLWLRHICRRLRCLRLCRFFGFLRFLCLRFFHSLLLHHCNGDFLLGSGRFLSRHNGFAHVLLRQNINADAFLARLFCKDFRKQCIRRIGFCCLRFHLLLCRLLPHILCRHCRRFSDRRRFCGFFVVRFLRCILRLFFSAHRNLCAVFLHKIKNRFPFFRFQNQRLLAEHRFLHIGRFAAVLLYLDIEILTVHPSAALRLFRLPLRFQLLLLANPLGFILDFFVFHLPSRLTVRIGIPKSMEEGFSCCHDDGNNACRQ